MHSAMTERADTFRGSTELLAFMRFPPLLLLVRLGPAASVSNILSQSTATATGRPAGRIGSSDVINAKAADFGAWQPARLGSKSRPREANPTRSPTLRNGAVW